TAENLYFAPQDPYTRRLLGSFPSLTGEAGDFVRAGFADAPPAAPHADRRPPHDHLDRLGPAQDLPSAQRPALLLPAGRQGRGPRAAPGPHRRAGGPVR